MHTNIKTGLNVTVGTAHPTNSSGHHFQRSRRTTTPSRPGRVDDNSRENSLRRVRAGR